MPRFRTPYGEKLAAREAKEAPYEGVPEWALASLLRWIMPFLTADGYFDNRSPADVCLAVERALRIRLDWTGDGPTNTLVRRIQSDQDLFLALIEFALQNMSWGWSNARSAAHELDRYLLEAGSVWRVVPTVPGQEAGPHHLERRTTPETHAALESLMSRGGSEADHLALAWSAAFGRDPDPSNAYREAVKAVEAAAQPVVLPQDPKATLGKVIASMRAKPSKWAFLLDQPVRLDVVTQARGTQADAVEVIVLLLDLLWVNQTDRHGEAGERRVITQAQAEEAVHLALTLVRFFKSGAVSPT